MSLRQKLCAYSDPSLEAKLFTWAREEKGSSAQVDYLTTLGTKILPIEVKAGVTGRLKSMQIFLDEKKLNQGIKVSGQRLGIDRRILSMPFYLLSQLHRFAKTDLEKEMVL